jgi:hypothetical protein
VYADMLSLTFLCVSSLAESSSVFHAIKINFYRKQQAEVIMLVSICLCKNGSWESKGEGRNQKKMKGAGGKSIKGKLDPVWINNMIKHLCMSFFYNNR